MEGYSEYEDDELIARFLSGKSSGEEQKQVAHRIKTDAAFAETVALTKASLALVAQAGYERHIRQLIKEVRQEERRQGIVTRMLGYLGGGMLAASVAFILFLSFAPLDLPVQPQEIRAVRNLQRNHSVDFADTSLKEKRRTFGLFFEAQSYLAEGRLQPAILKLEELARVRELRPYFKEAVQWHLVVAHLQHGNTERAGVLYAAMEAPTEYPIATLERWKVWWHLKLKEWLG